MNMKKLKTYMTLNTLSALFLGLFMSAQLINLELDPKLVMIIGLISGIIGFTILIVVNLTMGKEIREMLKK